MEALIILAVVVLMIASLWKMFQKAGKPGWASIVPIYNLIVLLDIAGKPWWWIFLYCIPLVSIVIAVMVAHAVSKAFGFGIGMTLLQVFLPFVAYPVMGFGSAVYEGGEE